MYRNKVAYYLFNLVEKDNCNKVTNMTAFHSPLVHFIIHICVVMVSPK
jgi:hypothetical protein